MLEDGVSGWTDERVPEARFCPSCGRPKGVVARPSDRTPWIIAGGALTGLLAVVLVMVARQSPTPPQPTFADASASAPAEAVPPDISSMSPRERFNRLYNRIMRGAQAGDEATVSRFTPMALLAYSQLDTIDADARFHAALLRVHTGDAEAARALGDTVLAQSPGHLFGYVILGTVARWQKDDKALARAYAGFLQHYDAEMKANREEYDEHKNSISDFRRAALEAQAKGSRP